MPGPTPVNVLVCVKRVPASSSAIVLTEDGQAVDGTYSGFTLSQHEQCAVEIAVRVATATGGEATVFTLGDPEAVEQVRAALAIGCVAATHVVADAQKLGPADVAREIAAVVRAHEAAGQRHDLVLLGHDAADTGDFQVGIRLSYELGRPVVNGVTQVSVGNLDGPPVFIAEGDGPDGHETYSVPPPAVVTILEGGVEPRYPSVPGRMKAKRVQVEQRGLSHEPTGPARVRWTLPPATPSNVQVLGTGPEAAPAVVDLLEQLGVLYR